MTPTASEIATWAGTRDAQARMPILLRRLIHGSVSTIREISFPGGDSVQIGGFDGILDVERGNAWIPDGKSVWETGCNKQPKGKADSDYKKRTAKTRRKERLASTFVFVTPRRWTKKHAWIKEKKAEGKWKDVRCFDADDIEQWAEQARSAATWLAEQIGAIGSGYKSASRCWEIWANASKPQLPRDLVLAGRAHEVAKLVTALQSAPKEAITIAADSRAEALAFACAAL